MHYKNIVLLLIFSLTLLSCSTNKTEEEKKISTFEDQISSCKWEKDENTWVYCSHILIVKDFFEKWNFNKKIIEKINNNIVDNDTITKWVFSYVWWKYNEKTRKIPKEIKEKLNIILKSKIIKPYFIGTRYSNWKECYNDEWSIFHLYIIFNDIENMRYLLDNKLFDIHKKYCYQEYPILQHLKPENKESIGMFQLLLEYWADPLNKNIMNYSTEERMENGYKFTKNKEEKKNIERVLNLFEKNKFIKILTKEFKNTNNQNDIKEIEWFLEFLNTEWLILDDYKSKRKYIKKRNIRKLIFKKYID